MVQKVAMNSLLSQFRSGRGEGGVLGAQGGQGRAGAGRAVCCPASGSHGVALSRFHLEGVGSFALRPPGLITQRSLTPSIKEISATPTVVQCHNLPARKNGKRSSHGVRESGVKWVTSSLYRV